MTGLAPISLDMTCWPSDKSRRRARLSSVMRRAWLAFFTSSVRRSGLKGFSMKSMAPMRIASTAIGTSPWPVIMMTGRPESMPISRLRNAMPSMPGMRISETTTPGQSAPITFSASSALANVSVSKPESASHWLIDSRMSGSSSTTAIFNVRLMGHYLVLFGRHAGSGLATRIQQRQLKFENGALAAFVRCIMRGQPTPEICRNPR